MVQLIAKLFGNTSGTQTSEFKLLGVYTPFAGLAILLLGLFEQRLGLGLDSDTKKELILGGLVLIGAGPVAYGTSRGLAKSGTTDGPYDAEKVTPPAAPAEVKTDADAANKVAGV